MQWYDPLRNDALWCETRRYLLRALLTIASHAKRECHALHSVHFEIIQRV